MSYKLTICITETLERLIEVEVDNIDCDPIEYVRQQYLDEEIILDANDAWLSPVSYTHLTLPTIA